MLSSVPKLKELLELGLSGAGPDVQVVRQSLHCLRAAGPVMAGALDSQLSDWLRCLDPWLKTELTDVRLLAASAAVALVKSRPQVLMNELIR